jgi:hypothetical protein
MKAIIELPDGTTIKIPVPFENETEKIARDRFYDWFIENTTLKSFERDEEDHKGKTA